MDNITYFGGFILGLMGAGHCLAMCGGIISSLSISSGTPTKKNWSFIVTYQIGRISSYTIFGAIAGWLGLQFNHVSPLPILKILSGVLLIAMALYMSHLWMGLSYLEKVGKLVWNKISPLTKKLLPATNHKQVIFLGALWGWLPCGLVYTSLGYALSLGNIFSSSAFMLMFGLGTLPATILAGGASLSLKVFLNHQVVRVVSSLMFLGMGIFTLYMVFVGGGHGHHH